MTTRVRPFLYILPLLGVTFLFLWQAEAVGTGVKAGLTLSYQAIIPSIFPFAILSTYLSKIDIGNESLLARVFSRLFHLPAQGVLPLFIGLFCGFPLGAKAVVEGYQNGDYTKDEAERLLAFTNNTGIGFLVAGVGISIRGSMRDGLFLFAVQLTSAIIAGLLMRGKERGAHRERPHRLQPIPPLPVAIKDALFSTLLVVSFVTFFSALLGITSTFLPKELQAGVACLLEVGTGTRLAASLPFGILYTAFAISFSGISVHMQTLSVCGDTDLSLFPYFAMKLVSGATSVILTLPYFYLLS
jgi:sporulation integral membrane protein YlbJ